MSLLRRAGLDACAGHSAAVVCAYCGCTIDATNKNLKVLCKADKKMKIKPLIPIGSKGTLAGGPVGGHRVHAADRWDGQLLLGRISPVQSFYRVSLADDRERPLDFPRDDPCPPDGDSGMGCARRGNVQISRQGKAKVVYVLGEFYWRVKTGDTVSVEDYIAPPGSFAANGTRPRRSGHWEGTSRPQEIRTAFGITGEFPAPGRVAPCQPSPYSKKTSAGPAGFWRPVSCLTLLQFYFIFRAANQVLYRQEFTIHGTRNVAYLTDLRSPQGGTNLEFALYSPVQNGWIDAGIDLIDDSRHTSIEFEQGSSIIRDGTAVHGARAASVPTLCFHPSPAAATIWLCSLFPQAAASTGTLRFTIRGTW